MLPSTDPPLRKFPVQETNQGIPQVVTGNYDYSNSAGGTGHAVDLVGMFDLPENKPKKQQ